MSALQSKLHYTTVRVSQRMMGFLFFLKSTFYEKPDRAVLFTLQAFSQTFFWGRGGKEKKNLQNNPQKPPVKLKQDKFSSDVTRIINNAHLSEHSRAS